MEKYLGHYVSLDGMLLGAPCGCYQCGDSGRQPGHIYCDNIPDVYLQEEEKGFIYRTLDFSGWHWYLTNI